MKRTFPSGLQYVGIPVIGVTWALAARLAWEQTVWSWEEGPQMVGFSLMHSGSGVLLVLAVLTGLVWGAAVLIAAAIFRSLGGKVVAWQLVTYALAWAVILAPYGFWQRLFIWKYTPAQAIEFLTYAAATGDLRTVKAFLDRGVDVNAQARNGTALHGAAVEGATEVIEFLIQRGADVNAINAYGDSPLANAIQARRRATETHALLTKHGGKLVRGSDEQRDRIIEEQVRRDIEELDKRIPK